MEERRGRGEDARSGLVEGKKKNGEKTSFGIREKGRERKRRKLSEKVIVER